MGIPMAASGLSTVATCLPLFATETVILNRFAAVLSITMGIGLAYVLLFLAPMMAMVGPVVTKTRAPVTASVLSRSLTVLLNSKAVRFMVVCMLALLTLVRPHRRKPSLSPSLLSIRKMDVFCRKGGSIRVPLLLCWPL